MLQPVPKVEDEIVTENIGNINPAQVDTTQKLVQLQNKISEYMKDYCSVYDVDCEKLIDSHGSESVHYLNESVQLIITDPPYHTRRSQNNGNSDYDYISVRQMERCVNLFPELLKIEGHGLMFCSDVQFMQWVYHLKTHTTMDDGKEKKTFSVEEISQKFIKKDGH